MNFLDTRHKQLFDWVQSLYPAENITLIPIQNDASFRRYFRALIAGKSYIVMDAPPGREDCRPFVAIAKGLFQQQINVPEILAENITEGFLLLSDLGDELLLGILNIDNVDALYELALQELLLMRECKQFNNYDLPSFDENFLSAQQSLLNEWYLTQYLDIHLNLVEQKILANLFGTLKSNILTQPYGFTHRDFHSRNILKQNNKLAILDFQDAMLGPITYDLVSLLKDCYIQWPKEKIQRWVSNYQQQLQNKNQLAGVSAQQFLQWFDWTGLHRHLRILGTFARLYIRDGKARYLNDMPRIVNYVADVLASYPELIEAKKLFETVIFPAFYTRQTKQSA